ncbi:putative Long-chain-fatty-acid--CoA ligase [Burkholderia multivorans]
MRAPGSRCRYTRGPFVMRRRAIAMRHWPNGRLSRAPHRGTILRQPRAVTCRRPAQTLRKRHDLAPPPRRRARRRRAAGRPARAHRRRSCILGRAHAGSPGADRRRAPPVVSGARAGGRRGRGAPLRVRRARRRPRDDRRGKQRRADRAAVRGGPHRRMGARLECTAVGRRTRRDRRACAPETDRIRRRNLARRPRARGAPRRGARAFAGDRHRRVVVPRRRRRARRAGCRRRPRAMRGADLHDRHDRHAQGRDAVASQPAVYGGGVERAAARDARRRRLHGAAGVACIRPRVGVPRQPVRGRDPAARDALPAGSRARRACRRRRVDLPGRARDAREAARTPACTWPRVARAALAVRVFGRLAARRRPEGARRTHLRRAAAQRLRHDGKQPHDHADAARRAARRLLGRHADSGRRDAHRRAGRTRRAARRGRRDPGARAERDARLLPQSRRDARRDDARRLAQDRRSRAARRRWRGDDRRTQQGADHPLRLQRLPGRGRTGAERASGRPAGGRRRPAGRRQRGSACVRRAHARRDGDRSGTARLVRGAARAVQAARAHRRARCAAGRVDRQGAQAQAARAGLTAGGACRQTVPSLGRARWLQARIDDPR